MGSSEAKILVLVMVVVVAGARGASAGPGFQGVDFQGVDFQGVDFQGVDFQGVDFQGVDFQGVDFQGADIDTTGLVTDGLELGGVEFPFVSVEGTDVIAFRYVALDDFVSVWEERHLDHYYLWRVTSKGVVRSAPLAGTLEGATLSAEMVTRDGLRAGVKLTIGAVEVDTSHNSMPAYSANDDLRLVELGLPVTDDAGGTTLHNVCGVGGRGLFVNGRWNRDGSFEGGGVSFACVDTGVVAKCIRSWGYKPWKTLTSRDGELVALYDYHLACVRAARADYCGDGLSHTRDGTPIDVADRHGFNVLATFHELEAFALENRLDRVPAFETESVFDSFGSVAHHEERFPTPGNQPVCGDDLLQFESGAALDAYFDASAPAEMLISVSSEQVPTDSM